MSCDGYYRHNRVMEIGVQPRRDGEPKVSFKDDREFLNYLLELERREQMALPERQNHARPA